MSARSSQHGRYQSADILTFRTSRRVEIPELGLDKLAGRDEAASVLNGSAVVARQRRVGRAANRAGHGHGDEASSGNEGACDRRHGDGQWEESTESGHEPLRRGTARPFMSTCAQER